jgi:hypothetical protein
MKKMPLTPDQLDAKLAHYKTTEKMMKEYAEKLEPLALEIVGLVDRYGATPKNAARSKELAAEIYRALITRSITSKIDEKKVADFKKWLGFKSAGAAIFKQLFATEVVHTIQPGAALFLARLESQKAAPRGLRSKFMGCQKLKIQNPRLKVEEIEKEKAAAAKKEAVA